MIKLHYQHGDILVFNSDDWATLRKTHRIVGDTIGDMGAVPKLPLKLQPEEAILLLEKHVAVVLRLRKTSDVIKNEDPAQIIKFEESLLEAEQDTYKNVRKRQLEHLIDKIVTGKRKKGDNRSAEEIFDEELNKSTKVTKENMIWPILKEPLEEGTNYEEVLKRELIELTTQTKYLVYKDLWHKNYYITSGFKFGGDYLVYKGDPVAYHALFIVTCVEEITKPMHPTEIIALGRLATNVKKRAVLASIDKEDNVSYITINWIDS